MLFALDWIGQYVELPDDSDELARRLTAAGHAVEGVERHAGDVAFDVDVTANRPDCMNHIGLARELAVILDRPLTLPAVEISEAGERAQDAARIAVDDPELCPRLVALVIRDVKVGPSPEWLRRRLEAIGQRSINNIVDVTNYVLWETGQPLHAYDLERLGGSEIIVRPARAGETLTTLDGERRELDPEVLVIADAAGVVGIAGVMGGLDTEVTDSTRHVLLESAHFDPRTVRRGARKLRLNTDASHRFERGADPEGCLWAARRAAALFVELAGGRVLDGALEIWQPRPEWPPEVDVELAKLDRFAGIETPAAEVERMLGGLGFGVERRGDGIYRITVPSWRYADFVDPYPADVYEEILRLRGFDSLPTTLPAIAGSDAPARPEHRLRRKLQDSLAACGFAEVINFAFHDREADTVYPSIFGAAPALEIANPLSDRYAVMRRSLLPSLVASAFYNQRRGAEVVRQFEIGHVFAAGENGEQREEETVALVMGGSLGTPWEHRIDFDFFDLKGVLEALAEVLGVELVCRATELPRLRIGAAAEIVCNSEAIGFLGELDEPESAFPLFAAELRTAPIAGTEISLETRTPSKFPGIAVDTTLTHALEIPWDDLERAIRECDVADLVDFGLKDRYRGRGVPRGAVNTTLYFLYNSNERSLTQEEVNERHLQLARMLDERFGFKA